MRWRRWLAPLLAEFVESACGEILRRHYRMNLDVCVEGEEPRLGKRWNLGGIRKIDDQDGAAPAIVVHKVGRFRFLLIKNFLHLLSGGAVAHRGVKGLVWNS